MTDTQELPDNAKGLPPPTPSKALALLFVASGGQSAIANFLGLSRAAVSKWRRCPAEHCAQLEELVDGQVTCEMLRPDIFPIERRMALTEAASRSTVLRVANDRAALERLSARLDRIEAERKSNAA